MTPARLTDVGVKEKDKLRLIPWFLVWANRRMIVIFTEVGMTDRELDFVSWLVWQTLSPLLNQARSSWLDRQVKCYEKDTA